MKTIGEWQQIATVINYGLRDIFTGIDSEILSKAEIKKEVAEYNRKKQLCKELLDRLYAEVTK